MMHTVRRLRLRIWWFLKALTIGKVMIAIFALTAGFGIYAVIVESQIPDDLRLMPVPTQHQNPIAVPLDYQP